MAVSNSRLCHHYLGCWQDPRQRAPWATATPPSPVLSSQFRAIMVIIFAATIKANMPQASKKRRRQAHGHPAESPTAAPRVLDQPSLRQTDHLTAVSLMVGKSPPPGRTAQEKEFANFLIGIISGSPNRRTISKEEILSVATARFGLSERRAKALREDVIDYLDASAWSKAGAPPGRLHRRTRG